MSRGKLNDKNLYMLDRIILKNLNSLETYPPDYEKGLESNVRRYIEYSGFQDRFQKSYIDVEKSNKKIKTLRDEFLKILSSDKNILVTLKSFKHSAFISSMLFEYAVSNYIETEEHVPKMLYIDTNQLLEDVSSRITSSRLYKEFTPITPINVMEREIYNADFVFWDKFNLSTVAFRQKELYSILSVRYSKCLNNMFFVNVGPDDYIDNEDLELLNVMDFKKCVNFTNIPDKDSIIYVDID